MTEELLNKLLMTAAPSGYEGAVQVVFREHIAPFVTCTETAKTEYVLAGTLLSILIAVLAGMMVIGVLKL